MNYVAALAVARSNEAKAAQALGKAVANCTIDPVFQKMALERDPQGWAMTLRKIADIAVTLPALRAQVATCKAEVAKLEERMCHRCEGTGLYQAPTTRYQQGKPLCFRCGGHGTR